MDHKEFDRCPECGASPKFGIRCHPKFSIKVGIGLRQEDGGHPDMVAMYTHDAPSQRVLHDVLKASGSTILDAEEWNGEKWVRSSWYGSPDHEFPEPGED